jgi:hypothetical protein
MKRRLLNWLYHRIDESGRIPRWVHWIWRSSHWCEDMDYLLIMDNTYDCFCGYAKQVMVRCKGCGEEVERRCANYKDGCQNCIPPEDLDHDPLF